MSDAASTALEDIAKTTKRGFDLSARLKKRGLRKATITLYLDEELGPKLGWAFDTKDAFGNTIARQREGVLGKIDAFIETKEQLLAARRAQNIAHPDELVDVDAPTPFDEPIKELEVQRDDLIKKLEEGAIVLHLKAVPPIIQKDCRRKARETLGLTEKGIPEDKQEDFNLSYTAHLMAMIIMEIKDNQSGESITEVTYDDAIELMGYLPQGQFQRLDDLLGTLQFADAISRSIEGQEDFS